jgi:hypothetical protein
LNPFHSISHHFCSLQSNNFHVSHAWNSLLVACEAGATKATASLSQISIGFPAGDFPKEIP